MNTENNIESPECRVVVSSTAIVRRLLELPPETEIQQPDGIWRRLTDNEYESANHTDTIYGDRMPFWVQGWRDLHHRLRVPKGSDSKRIDWLAYNGCAWAGCEKTHKDWQLDKGEMWIERYNGSLRDAIDEAMSPNEKAEPLPPDGERGRH